MTEENHKQMQVTDFLWIKETHYFYLINHTTVKRFHVIEKQFGTSKKDFAKELSHKNFKLS